MGLDTLGLLPGESVCTGFKMKIYHKNERKNGEIMQGTGVVAATRETIRINKAKLTGEDTGEAVVEGCGCVLVLH